MITQSAYLPFAHGSHSTSSSVTFLTDLIHAQINTHMRARTQKSRKVLPNTNKKVIISLLINMNIMEMIKSAVSFWYLLTSGQNHYRKFHLWNFEVDILNITDMWQIWYLYQYYIYIYMGVHIYIYIQMMWVRISYVSTVGRMQTQTYT